MQEHGSSAATIDRSERAAQRTLVEQEARRLAAATFSPYITLFAAVCTVSAIGPMTMWFAEPGVRSWVTVLVVGIFALVLLATPLAIGRTGDVRGFKTKWVSLLVVWALLFMVACVMPLFIPEESIFHFGFLVIFALAFLVLMIGAIVLEQDRVMKARREFGDLYADEDAEVEIADADAGAEADRTA